MGEQLNQRTDSEGVQQRPDTDVAAEDPAGPDDHEFDARANQPDGQTRSRDEPGHQAVARPGPHSGTDVQRGGEGVDDDPGEQQRHP